MPGSWLRSPWPTPRQMEDLVVSGEPVDRVLLGRLAPDSSEGRLLRYLGLRSPMPALAAPSCHGVLVVGTPRSGKTTSVLVPTVRRWKGTVIATSIRGDLLANTMRPRKEEGWPILVYNPTRQGQYGSHTWSPLVAAMGEQPWEGARRMATALIAASELVDDGANTKRDFWNATAADYLGPLLLAAAADGPSMEPVRRWLKGGGITDDNGVEGGRVKEEVRARLRDHPKALHEAEAVWGLHYKMRDSIYLTARTALSAYENESVLQTCGPASGGMPDITPETVFGNSGSDGKPAKPGATLYIVSPPAYGWRDFAPLFAALVNSLIEAAYDRANTYGKLDPPLLLALDEVANISPIRDLPRYSSTAAGEGIQLVTVLHNLAQAERIWGEADTRLLLDTHSGGRLIFGGSVDERTLNWIQTLLGEIDRERVSHSEEGFFGSRTRTRSWERQPVATAAEIRTMPKGTALLFSGSLPPARVRLRQWTTV